jgi:hypothetical protein
MYKNLSDLNVGPCRDQFNNADPHFRWINLWTIPFKKLLIKFRKPSDQLAYFLGIGTICKTPQYLVIDVFPSAKTFN